MGHVESGGAATAALTEHEVWPLWRSYKRLFATWMMPISVFTTPGAWGWLGNDVVSGLRRNPSTRRAFELLSDTPIAQFNALSALATLNQRRQEVGFQMLVVFYVTVPVTIFVSAGEINPEGLMRFVSSHGDSLWLLAIALGVATLIYLAALWRARQMVQVLDLIRIERAMSPLSTVELRNE